MPPQYLEFEITESMNIKDFEAAVNSIRIIKDFGIKIRGLCINGTEISLNTGKIKKMEKSLSYNGN